MIEEVESGTAVSVSSERHNEHCSKGPDSKSSGTEDKVRKVPLVRLLLHAGKEQWVH